MPELVEHVVAKDAGVGPSIYDYQLDGSKVGWYRERIEAWQRGEKIAPITIDAAWTRKCQYACGFCYASLQSNPADGEITLQNAKDFLTDAADLGVRGVSLISDGESTVVPWYAESIEHGAKAGLAIGIGSNGQKLKRPMLEKILPFASYLRFNFSAGTPGRYSEVMGVKPEWFHEVIQNVKDAMEIKRRDNLPVNINMQMVTMPEYHDQIMPLARLAKEIRPDYLIFKHCADDKSGTLGVDYTKYDALHDTFKEAEALSDETFRVVVKWSRIRDEGKRRYTRCYGAPFIMQVSGTGLVSTCGFHFNSRFSKFHIGNITKERFRDIWASDRYWDVMRYVSSEAFNPQQSCGANCLQTKTNEFLYDYVNGKVSLPMTPAPPDLAFI